jgi:hypothetical protein
LPDEKVGRYRRAQDGDERGEKCDVPAHVWNENAIERFSPGYFHGRERDYIGKQAERQPLQDGYVTVVIEEDLSEDRDGPEQHHIGDGGTADEELEGVGHCA